jgi:cell division protein FtsB
MYRKVFFTLILVAMVGLNAKLVASLVGSIYERKDLLGRLEILEKKKQETDNQFVLKQDFMRKMLTDKDFVEQVIRRKEGYIKRTETVFKFGD